MTTVNVDEVILDQWLSTAIRAAKVGGEVLQSWIGRFSVREKSRANLVTEADEASQAAIVSVISEAFPDHGFLGEEGLNRRDGETGNHCFWIIDPLDGTSNYVHGFPYYAVSIALYANQQLQVGVIYDPTRDDVFAASQGGGATLNGKTITTSGTTEAGQCFAMASLPIAADPANPAVRRFLTALPRLQTVQRTGSAAMNLASVAAGRADAFWSTSLHPWDIAAGVLLVKEAGGSVTTLSGGAIDIFAPDILVASSVELQQELTAVLG
ncbi:MAG: inositol monophosphatase [Planctomycetaceae bacterium]|nr:inositol monophosphatase [Planctomycetaceae bacterium]